ncbi:MAG TPA: hypothetical protein VLA48_05075, partial [Nitrososphaeraceae archaeon]|nr:hypothetical protein [Nitrososphaeraceae archaeon]
LFFFHLTSRSTLVHQLSSGRDVVKVNTSLIRCYAALSLAETFVNKSDGYCPNHNNLKFLL